MAATRSINRDHQDFSGGNKPVRSTRHYDVLDWERDGRYWPNRDSSRFVDAGGIRWHVQVMGQGPTLLLLHGTGAASHSWRDLAPLLAQHYTVLAPDLPGHGFSQLPTADRLSLSGMSALLDDLLQALTADPAVIAGHSAGAAIAAQMCLEGSISPRSLISLNGALLPLTGLQGHLFLPMARFLSRRPMWARLLARSACEPKVVRRLLDRTGSVIEPRGIDLYATLLRNNGHTAAALGMMANWDLHPLLHRLPELKPELLLVVGENDRMVPAEEAERIKARLPAAEIHSLPGYGHLLHEEQPEEIAALIAAMKSKCGDSPGT